MARPVAQSPSRERGGPRERGGARHQGPALEPREELIVVRAGAWRFLVPTRNVERIHPAALPAAVPATETAAPMIALGADLVPVVFAQALFGATEARLAKEHKMVLLSERHRRALLWVDAVEDVVEHAPVEKPEGSEEELVAGWSGGDRTLAVIDVSRLLDLAVGPAENGGSR